MDKCRAAIPATYGKGVHAGYGGTLQVANGPLLSIQGWSITPLPDALPPVVFSVQSLRRRMWRRIARREVP